MAEQNLKDKTVKGVAWSGVGNVSQFAITFVVSIVLARLLTPDDYGLIGIITIFTTVCNVLINGGFSSALIRKKEVNQDDYNTVFIVNLVMSSVLYLFIYFCSPFIADFFGREELIALTRVSSLSLLIGALAIVQQTRLTKQIDFKTQTKVTFISSLLSGVIGIIMALVGCGVWSLVGQMLSYQSLRTMLLWRNNRWIPNLFFSINSFKDMFTYGWKIMAVDIINSIWSELYQVVVGKFYSPTTLGQYTRAKHFSQFLSNSLTGVVRQVSFPVMSNIQDERERLVSAIRRIIRLTMFLSAISLFVLGAVSEPLLYCLVGPKWHEASLYMPIICISSSLFPLHAINLNILEVQGRSDLFLGIEIVKKLLIFIPLYVGTVVGIMPMLWINILISVISFFLNSFYTGKLLGYNSWMQIKDILPSYATALAIAIPVWFLKFLPLSSWAILPLMLISSVAIFFGICNVFKITEYKEIVELITPFLKNIKPSDS